MRNETFVEIYLNFRFFTQPHTEHILTIYVEKSISYKILCTDYFYKHPLSSSAVEFSVEDLLPGSEIEPAFGNRHDDFASHNLSFHVGIGVVLPHVMPIL